MDSREPDTARGSSFTHGPFTTLGGTRVRVRRTSGPVNVTVRVDGSRVEAVLKALRKRTGADVVRKSLLEAGIARWLCEEGRRLGLEACGSCESCAERAEATR